MPPEAVILLTRLGGARCEKLVREEVSGADNKGEENKTPAPRQQPPPVAEGATVGELEAGRTGLLLRRDENATPQEAEEKENSMGSGGVAETEPARGKAAVECPAACFRDKGLDGGLEEREASVAAVATACRLRRFWDHFATAAATAAASRQKESCSGLAQGSVGGKPPNSAITRTATNATIGGATVATPSGRKTVLLHVCSGPGSVRAVRQALAEEGSEAGVFPVSAFGGEKGQVNGVHGESGAAGGAGGGGGGGTGNEGMECRLGGTTVAALGSLRRHGAYCVVELGFPNSAAGDDNCGAGGGLSLIHI